METSSQSGKKTSHSPAHTPPSPSPPPPLPPTTTSPPPPPPAPLLSPVTEVAAKDTGSAAVVLEDDKDRIVVEIMQMYGRQQEKLNSTLHKQLQLEMVSFWGFFGFGMSKERKMNKEVHHWRDAARPHLLRPSLTERWRSPLTGPSVVTASCCLFFRHVLPFLFTCRAGQRPGTTEMSHTGLFFHMKSNPVVFKSKKVLKWKKNKKELSGKVR